MTNSQIETPDQNQTTGRLTQGQKIGGRYILKNCLRDPSRLYVSWLATEERSGRDVVLKFLPNELYSDDTAVDDLKRIAGKNISLNHSGIVRISDYLDDGQELALVTENVSGLNLSSYRLKKANRVLEIDELNEWVPQVCKALTYAYEEVRALHRDLDPNKLLLTEDGRIKVTDFGIGAVIDEAAMRLGIEGMGFHRGLVYKSPQQVDGEEATVLDDVYSLGITLYELLASKPPFFCGDIASQIREKSPHPLNEKRASLRIEAEYIPEHWETLIAACLAKDPSQRPQSMQDLREGLLRKKFFASSLALEQQEQAPENVVVSPAVEQIKMPTAETLAEVEDYAATHIEEPTAEPLEAISPEIANLVEDVPVVIEAAEAAPQLETEQTVETTSPEAPPHTVIPEDVPVIAATPVVVEPVKITPQAASEASVEKAQPEAPQAVIPEGPPVVEVLPMMAGAAQVSPQVTEDQGVEEIQPETPQAVTPEVTPSVEAAPEKGVTPTVAVASAAAAAGLAAASRFVKKVQPQPETPQEVSPQVKETAPIVEPLQEAAQVVVEEEKTQPIAQPSQEAPQASLEAPQASQEAPQASQEAPQAPILPVVEPVKPTVRRFDSGKIIVSAASVAGGIAAATRLVKKAPQAKSVQPVVPVATTAAAGMAAASRLVARVQPEAPQVVSRQVEEVTPVAEPAKVGIEQFVEVQPSVELAEEGFEVAEEQPEVPMVTELDELTVDNRLPQEVQPVEISPTVEEEVSGAAPVVEPLKKSSIPTAKSVDEQIAERAAARRREASQILPKVDVDEYESAGGFMAFFRKLTVASILLLALLAAGWFFIPSEFKTQLMSLLPNAKAPEVEIAKPEIILPEGKTLLVPDEYKSIQAAIDAASSGDVVKIKPGVYLEGLVMKDGVHLLGVDRDTCIIQLAENANAVLMGTYLTSASVKNLTFRNNDVSERRVYALGWTLEKGKEGIVVKKLEPGCVAEQAGIRVGDRILSVDGRKITENDLALPFYLLARGGIAREVEIVTQAGNEPKTLNLLTELSSPEGNWPDGIVLINSSANISNCKVTGLNGFGALVYGPESKVSISDSSFIKNGTVGIVYGNGATGTVEKNICEDNTQVGIVISDPNSNVNILENTCKGGMVGIAFLTKARGKAEKNICEDNEKSGIVVREAGSAATLVENVVKKSSVGISFSDGAGGMAEKNIIQENKEIGILIEGMGTKADLVENTSKQNRVGIAFIRGAGGIAKGNICEENTGVGIWSGGVGTEVDIVENTSSNNKYGIDFADGATGTVEGNVCNMNKEHGLVVRKQDTNPVVKNNKFFNNGGYGLAYEEASSPVIEASNSYGYNIAGDTNSAFEAVNLLKKSDLSSFQEE
ncbi:MAG: right-handed parallel beta-helix repeat-containing protein [Chthoniobacterales bacterium]